MLESWLGTLSRVEFFESSISISRMRSHWGSPGRPLAVMGHLLEVPRGTQHNAIRADPFLTTRGLSTGDCRGHGEHMQHVFEAEVPGQAIVVEASQATEAVARQLLKRRRDSIAGRGHQCQWVA
jgi:hypothetical protein